MGKETPPKEKEAEGSPRKKSARVDDAAPVNVPVMSAPSLTGKTTPKGKEAEGSPRKKAPRVDDMAPVKVPVSSAPSPTGKTLPKGDGAEGSPLKKSPGLDDAALFKIPVTSGKTPPKGEEAEGSPRKKAPRVDDTAPGASKANPTGEALPKGEAKGSSPKRSRTHRKKSRRLDKISRPLAAPPLATVPEGSELFVEAAKGASDEKRCKCNHVITESATEEMAESVTDQVAWVCRGCRREDEKGIVKTRPAKIDLLICVTCYQNLCCGVGSIAYPFGHSRAHALKEKHWFAVLFCDPERGYCFKCNAEVPVPVFREGRDDYKNVHDDYKNCPGQIRARARDLQGLPPSVGQTKAEFNPKKVEMTVKVQIESGPSGFDVDLADKWPSYESRSCDAQGYAIRGIPNLGFTCYMNAVLQCLFVLGKLRERILAVDCPKFTFAEVLKGLFVEASAAGDLLNAKKVLDCVQRKNSDFKVGIMQDSIQLIELLCELWKEGEEIDNRESVGPTVFDSIFGFQTTRTLSCKKCDYSSLRLEYWRYMRLDFPPKWHPTKSAASPQTSKSPSSQKREITVQLFPADVQRYLEKMQTDSEIGYPHVIGSEVIAEEAHKPLEVDSTEAQHISQRKDVVESPSQIQKGKSVNSLTEDSMSIEEFLKLFLEEEKIDWKCDQCTKDHEEPSASQSKHAVQSRRIAKLPPVLILQLNRTAHEGTSNTFGLKISAHVRFTEYLDAEPLVDPSIDDKGITLYRLAGVVEHIGKVSLKAGHYIAYVRARRLGNQQEDSSEWFCADDHQIRQVTFEHVENMQAYILFYERMAYE